ncbi:MAG: hypothetical protein E7178_04145 [Erysipelotrichaceae bacterium]|nr:hypothetical protein [Erysipelotrichaceae bacterium]
MQVSLGREKAKRNIVIFVIGTFLLFIASVLTNAADVAHVEWLNYFVVMSFVGTILQIIAIVLLRNVNKCYANSLWALILSLLCLLVVFILTLIASTQQDPTTLAKVADGFSIASSIAEALVVIFFVKGTNQLAEENDKGMPILTKIIIRGYILIFLLSIILSLLSYIPAIGENATVVNVFAIIILVLYVIREIAYLFFLIKSLWRVK